MTKAVFLLGTLLVLAPVSQTALARPLSAAARQRLDRVALRQQGESVAQEHVNRAGNIPAWLLAHAGLPEAEELARCRAFHEQLRGREKLSPASLAGRRTLARLVCHLPAHLRPSSFRYTLYRLEREQHVAFSPGGGLVYLSRPLEAALLAEPRRGEAALAFVLARELGHIGLNHCRRGWQRIVLEEDLRKGVASRVEAGRWRTALDTAVRGSGPLLQFLYTRDQEYEADLFALQLCENAGYPGDHCLDGLRIVAALRHPGALRRDDYRPQPGALPATLAYYLSPSADPLLRLRRLLMERDGLVEQETEFGLFLHDRATAQLKRAADRSLTAADRPIIFLHGMGGGPASFHAFLADFGPRRELRGRKLLVFRYPNNGSLARSGRFLAREMRRVSTAPASATFVCHSAGGLVFRYYAERLQGRFRHAVILGTPHAGSDLTGLKFLVDAADLAGGIRALGPARALADAIPHGKGEIALDLHPDSLFLRQLGHDRRLAARYHFVVGEYLSPAQALALRLTFAASKRWLLRKGVPGLPDGMVKAHAARWLGELRLPREVLGGDLVVSTASASLPGAGQVSKLRLHHLAIRTEPEALRVVLGSVLEH